MLTDTVFDKLPEALLPWYSENKRELPWRNSRDPYKIWISEIMLQQTRVEAVRSYYTRFLKALPTIEDLANADDELLQKLWEGLGYYSRVRNLKKAAQQIIKEHNGSFPQTYNEVLSLAGIGPYTAGAVCSIAFGLPTPAVDGNVLRVIARLTDDDSSIDTPQFRKKTEQALSEIYPASAGEFTQALMELGATVCGPNRKPVCEACPCVSFCRGKSRAGLLPVKSPKKQRKEEKKTVFILACEDKIAITKRPKTGLLADLWQLPDTVGKLTVKEAIAYLEELGCRVTSVSKTVERQHIFTHIVWKMRGVYLQVENCAPCFTWKSYSEIAESAAIPTAYRQFLEEGSTY